MKSGIKGLEDVLQSLQESQKKSHISIFILSTMFHGHTVFDNKMLFFHWPDFLCLTGKYVVCSTYSWIKLQHFCYEPQKTPLVFWWVSLYSYFDFVNFF